jgi:chromosome segregation ATPase
MKLLESAVTFGKNFSVLTRIGQVATVAILLYVAFIIGTCSQQPNDDTALTLKIEQVTNYANSLETQVKTLQDTVAQKESTITILTVDISRRQRQQEVARKRISVLDNAAAEERMLLPPTPFTDTLIAELKDQLVEAEQIMVLKDSVIALREKQVQLLQSALVISEHRGDTLQATLNVALAKYQKKDKLFGKIPLPSRKAVAITALIGGAYLGATAVK